MVITLFFFFERKKETVRYIIKVEKMVIGKIIGGTTEFNRRILGLAGQEHSLTSRSSEVLGGSLFRIHRPMFFHKLTRRIIGIKSWVSISKLLKEIGVAIKRCIPVPLFLC